MKRVVIIGSGIGGLATANLLAKKEFAVTVLEKNEMVGGRASVFEAKGYRFDVGPSWYLMPDVFEHYFDLMGEKLGDHLQLKKLAPSYRVFFKDTDKVIDFFADVEKTVQTVENLEPGSGERLREYLKLSESQYRIATENFMYKNYDSWRDFFNWQTLIQGSRLSVFTPMNTYVGRFFKNSLVQKIMQYQLVFLGSSPYNTPALYNIMSHIDFNLGVYYPQGGIYEIVVALKNIGEKYGVRFVTDAEVNKILVDDANQATGVSLVSGAQYDADLVISNGDIHHTETKLLAERHRSFTPAYWKSRVSAPSGFIMYLGVRGKISSLTHHNLLFAEDWQQNFAEIFDRPQFPSDPSIYVCAPSKTDPTVAPDGCENLFVLVPIASGLDYTEEYLDQYKEKILATLSKDMGIEDLVNRIEYCKLFCVKDFAERYYSFRGSALGLAHTLKQTALFRPNTVSKKVKNLYYVGGNTNPGIGMPICLISAELVYKRIMNIKTAPPLQQL